jgi:hypothetical protein
MVIATKLPEDVDTVLPHAIQTAHRAMSHKHEDIEALIAELRTSAAAEIEPATPSVPTSS